MKRPAKVTRETRPSQYARKLYGKKREEQLLDWEAAGAVPFKNKKKVRTQLNRRLRRMKKDIADGGAYKRELDMDEVK